MQRSNDGLVCRLHSLERCFECCFDFSLFNRAAPSATELVTRKAAIANLTQPGQVFELRRNNSGHLHFWNAPKVLGNVFAMCATSRPFLKYEDEAELSFEQVYEKAMSLAHWMVDTARIGKGDFVYLACRNYSEWVVAFMAIVSIGAVCCCVNALWASAELIYAAEEAAPKLYILDSERVSRMSPFLKTANCPIVVIRGEETTDSNQTPFESIIGGEKHHSMPNLKAELVASDEALVIYTSGSTGRPKGAVASHENVIQALLSWELDTQIGILVSGFIPPLLMSKPTATLLAVPLFHATGLMLGFLASFRSQRRIVLMYKWQPLRAFELIERERITSFHAPSAMSGDLIRVFEEKGRKPESLLSMGGGGAPRNANQVARIGRFVAPTIGWGMSETLAIGCGHGGESYIERPDSSGVISAICEMKIAGGESRGELLISGVTIVKRYLKNRGADSWIEGNYFKTGDVAYIDDSGHVYIVDRLKDLIIRGGENIGCSHVESIVSSLEGVFECCVYAIPDERLGEEVGCTVYCSESISVDALQAHVGALLAHFERPRFYRLLHKALPRIASGKLFKRQLRAEHIRELEDSRKSNL